MIFSDICLSSLSFSSKRPARCHRKATVSTTLHTLLFMLLKIVRVCRRCMVEERLPSSRTFDCSTGFHVVPLSFGVCMCWAFKQEEQILKRINIRSQTKAVGCLLISPARLPDDTRCRYLMLSLFLSLSSPLCSRPPVGKRFYIELRRCATGQSVIIWLKQEPRWWKQTCR